MTPWLEAAAATGLEPSSGTAGPRNERLHTSRHGHFPRHLNVGAGAGEALGPMGCSRRTISETKRSTSSARAPGAAVTYEIQTYDTVCGFFAFAHSPRGICSADGCGVRSMRDSSCEASGSGQGHCRGRPESRTTWLFTVGHRTDFVRVRGCAPTPREPGRRRAVHMRMWA